MLRLKCQWAVFSSGGSIREVIVSKLPQIIGNIHFLAVVAVRS